ncbi:hypothetical protein H8959_021060 [Pygathrix nigripes]
MTRKKQKEDVEVVGGSDGEGAIGLSSDPKSREQMINDRIERKTSTHSLKGNFRQPYHRSSEETLISNFLVNTVRIPFVGNGDAGSSSITD